MLLLEHSADISRSQAVGTNGRMTRAIVATYPCLALPLDAQASIQNGFTVGKAWEVFFDLSSDVQTGDLLTVNGTDMTVSGVQPYDVPIVAHKRALCSQERP